jgi:nitroimidazol reductase NimA-like FMN-containing flavoprotein (pyridoxamine 5'-phosphate oxidase superfamily)
MFREVRRRDRVNTEAEARDILARAEYGVLATVGEDGWPYAVPLNHTLAGDVLYLHCATEGHKLENLAHEERVSYCAVASAQVIPSKMSTLYESAVVFGRAVLVTDAEEKRKALKLLADRFFGGEPAERLEEAICKSESRTAVIRIQLERITGKAHRSSTT